MFGRVKPSVTAAPSGTEPTTSQPVTIPQHTLCRLPPGDDVFVMDGMDMTHSPSANMGALPPTSSSATAIPISA